MLLSFIVYFFVALIIGAIATVISGYSHTGCIIKIIIGFIGTLLGYVITTKLNLSDFLYIDLGSRSIPLLWSLICATLFVAIVSIFTRR